MPRKPVAMRLEPELWARVESRADELGQTRTKFVERALERALGEPLPSSGLALDLLTGPPPLRALEQTPEVSHGASSFIGTGDASASARASDTEDGDYEREPVFE